MGCLWLINLTLLHIVALDLTVSVLGDLIPVVVQSPILLPHNSSGILHDMATRPMELFTHFKEPYDKRVVGQLTLYGIDVSPSSIHFGWSLTNRTFAEGTLEATVICETYNGRMVSNKLHPTADTFKFEFLNSDTEYTVCVYMLERSSSSDSQVLHYQCAPFRTIPLVRSDSVLGVALTLGYIVLMVLIGYIVWFRRSLIIKRRRSKSRDAEDDMAHVKILNDKDSAEDNAEYGDFDERYEDGRPGCSGFSRKSTSHSEPALNGSFSHKAKNNSQGSLSALCTRGQKEEYLIHYNVKEREITF